MPTARAASTAAKKSTATAAKPTTRAAAKPAAAKTAAKPAAKAAPAKAAPATASRRAKAAAPVEEEVDLLAGLSDETSTVDDADDESFDLLSDITEDGGTPWYPWDADDQPDGIQGRIQYIGTVDREERFGGGEAPYLEIQDKNDADLIWAVRGYATVLANQLNKAIDQGLSVGDMIGIMYFGEKENRKGDNSYKNFKVVVKKR